LVAENDRPLLEQSLAERGFGSGGRGDGLTKTIRFASNDPVLAGEETSVTLGATWSSDLTRLLEREEGGTNAASALRSVRERLARRTPDDANPTVHVELFTLSPEDLVVAVAADVGFAREDRLFLACRLVDLLRSLPNDVDWDRVRDGARTHGVLQQVEAGLGVASTLTDRARDLDVGRPPRILEWARYGPSSVNRYPWLRAAYYFVLSFVTVQGARRKLGYVGRGLVGGRADGRPVLPTIAVAAARGVAASLTHRRPELRDFAYWVEPATSERLVFIGPEEPADRA
jgi:hypothetical protein